MLAPELMSQYRKLDDSINMRLNRTTAQYRDRERSGLGRDGDVEEQACAHVWKEFIGAHPSMLARRSDTNANPLAISQLVSPEGARQLLRSHTGPFWGGKAKFITGRWR